MRPTARLFLVTLFYAWGFGQAAARLRHVCVLHDLAVRPTMRAHFFSAL